MAKKDKIIKTAEKYVKQGKLANAAAEYKKLLEINPNDWGTINLIGDLCARIGVNHEAIEYFNRLGEHYAKDGFYLKAIAIYKKITKLEPNNMPSYAKLGHLYAKQGLALEARANYQIVAEHYVNHRELAKAAEIYQSLAELEPDNPKVRLKLAEINFRLGRKEESVKELAQIAKEFIKREKLDESRQILKKILEMQPSNSDALFNLADIYCKTGDPEKAIGLFNRSLKKDPENIELNSRLGEIYLKLGDINKAEETFKKVAQKARSKSIAQMHLGLVSLAQGKLDEAYTSMEPYIDELIEDKEEEKAISYLTDIIEKNSRHVPTLDKLAKIYISLSQVAPLISILKTLSDIYIETEDFKKAYNVMEKLVDLDSENTELLKKLNWLRSQISYGAEEEEVAVEEEEKAEISEIEMEAKEEVKEEEKVEEVLEKEEVEIIEFEEESVAEEKVKEAPQITIPDAKEMRGERLKVLDNAIIEAEIFTKYGLLDKAMEKLLSLLPEFNLNPQVHKNLKDIYIELGNYEDAANEYKKLIMIYEDRGEQELSKQAHHEAMDILPSGMIEENYDKLAESISEKGIAEMEVFEEEIERVPYIDEEIEEGRPLKTAEVKPSEAIGEISHVTPETEEEISPVEFVEPVPFEPEAYAPAMEEEALEPEELPADKEAGSLEDALLEALEEVDFYLDQGFPREGQSLLINLYQRFPSHKGVLQRLKRLGISPEAIEKGEIISLAPEEMPAAEVELPVEEAMQPSEIETELTEAFSKYEESEAVEEAKASFDEPIDLRADKFVTDEELFAEEESFFNLSAELGEDFLQSLVPEEEAAKVDEREEAAKEKDELKTLLKDLKEDIKQQVEEEDYETRYNLGIAYKEMSLVDEAIGEFQISLKSPIRYVDSCTMLGLCFIEKGMNDIALQWFHKAIDRVEREEEKLGILYYMAQVYQQMDKLDKALDIYNFIYKEDAHFQDVADRIQSLTTKE